MIRTLDQRYVKPTLEHLEERIQPSFLLGSGSGTGNVTALAVPLTKAATDMTSASNLLASDIASLKSAATVAQAEKDYGFCCADYQRILSDHAFVVAIVPVDINFINAVAVSEFIESGDITDVAILRIPFLTNLFNPLSPLNNALSQANSIWNNGQLSGSLTTDIAANPTTLNALLSTTSPIDAAATNPVLS